MSPANEPIAVVGSGCRFPGDSTSPSKLWNLLRQPRDVLSKIDRFQSDGYYHPDGHHHGTSNVRDSYLLSQDPRVFDPQFFNIQPGEAESIDPQQRLLLETVYESVEAAGLTIESLQGSSTAVYVGVMCDDYSSILYHDVESIPTYAATGSARSILSNRISYYFDWRGPSMTIDTACSSSLVAVHQAVQVLRSGQSRVAVAAGANLIFGPNMYIAESNLSMLSPTGRSQMWDANANGYARGEGIAAVVLKTLSTAIADGDHIECIIRETGVNQDGRTTGITMPSSSAQAALIRETYARAGLDLRNPDDRCQYFEAHGTGTQAGDPQEAEAIYRAFFAQSTTDKDDTLYVGSIKTVIGHTEGTAGLAGLLKASLAVQNKIIPPNMHFNNLNPKIAPFYGHLQIVTEAKNWPTLPPGVARRASVNSFGFGGTNAHAIIESYQRPPSAEEKISRETTAASQTMGATPMTFSATSERSLTALLGSYASFLRKNLSSTNLRNLSWTLNTRRSALSYRASFSAPTIEDLCNKIDAKLEEKKSGSVATIGTKSITRGSRILGVFTGQGAQWATMGRDLIVASTFAERVIGHLEQSLAELPIPDRPKWSLKTEIMASAATSRLSDSAFSQPLCTAIQIVLVDVLRHAGIIFDSVVGHSSGEIAAAYTAGFITAYDAIRIAYYRGLYTHLACGNDGNTGAMVAAGTTLEDATELCDLPRFTGRVVVAACNSSASVTLSGDKDAVDHVRFVLEDESKFARILKVDTAYHSHHMKPCSDPYLRSLKACDIKLQAPRSSCAWYSSVYGGTRMRSCEELKGAYWNDNMVKPVLFAQALQQAVTAGGAPAITLEVGPHPALKGPASLTIEEVLGSAVPYSGTLSRGNNDLIALSEILGFVWKYLGGSIVDFTKYDASFDLPGRSRKHQLLKGLPAYSWDHERIYWNESRASRVHRSRQALSHELLGARNADDVEGQYHWRNYLRPSEMPWLRGHQIQGQMLFPAAGFAVMAFEASKVLAPVTDVQLIEIQDFSIHRAMAFYDEVAGVETLFSLSNVVTKNVDEVSTERTICADFACHACGNKDSGTLTSMASGRLRLKLGEPSLQALPQRAPLPADLTNVDVDYFYSCLATIGYGYTGVFHGITSLSRTTDASTGSIYTTGESTSDFLIHPATLDVAFQAIFAAIGAPGDGSLWTLHIPTMIKRIQLNPSARPSNGGLGLTLPFDANMVVAKEAGMCGDVEIYDSTGHTTIVQVEGLEVTPLSAPTAKDDWHIFAKTIWGLAAPDVETIPNNWAMSESEIARSQLAERTCFFYLRTLYETVSDEDRMRCGAHQARLLEWAQHVLESTEQGQHPTCGREWLKDTRAEIQAQIEKAATEFVDLKRLIAIGERLIPFVRNHISIPEPFMELGHTFGLAQYNVYLGQVAQQIAHRHRNMDILEIGAGAGKSTQAILNQIGHTYGSYTYTDTSVAQFAEARELFKDHSSSFIYKTLDIGTEIMEQEFLEHSYDLIIASNSMHKVSLLEKASKNLRKLLRPGGYFILLEATNTMALESGFISAGLPEWWVDDEDNRRLTPLLSVEQWDNVFRRTGFSGVDTVTSDSNLNVVPYSILVTQAVDTQINLIRQPLLTKESKPMIDRLLILGGSKARVSHLISEITVLMEPFTQEIILVDKLENLDMSVLASKPLVLSLIELEIPFFKPFTAEKLEAAQSLFDQSKNILWVGQGCRGDQPYANMMNGVSRCLVCEVQQLHLQMLDFDISEDPDARFLAETLLRLHISQSWKTGLPDYHPLWTSELQLAFTQGHVEIPRYVPSTELNDRYNSARRLIKKNLLPGASAIAIACSDSTYDLQELQTLEAVSVADVVEIQVSRSMLTALEVRSVGYIYLVIGTVVKTQEKVLAFSDRLQSLVSVPKSWLVPCEIDGDQESGFILSFANDLLADSILRNTASDSSVLVHEPTPSLALALIQKAIEKKVEISFTTTKSEISGSHWTHIHPSTPARGFKAYLPAQVTVYLDLSGSADRDSIGVRISRYLPSSTERKEATACFDTQSLIYAGRESNENVELLLWKAVRRLSARSVSLGPVEEEITLGDVQDRSTRSQRLNIVNWTPNATVPIRVRPAEEKVHFKKNKTYLLVGLTGELGRSLVRWMIHLGAKYIALTSRNPKIDQGWLDAMGAMGAVIKVFAMDVTMKDSLLSAYKTICRTMPPIAGVANGAMVLQDTLFANMTHENMNRQLKPKVDGSRYLDQLFSTKDLDFFILFSSLCYVLGNWGQTPYAAANAFMVSLIHGRRKRGLVGSVMNLGGIKGLGYIDRTDRGILERLNAMGVPTTSERDFLHFFAEAVLAGPPGSGKDPEISTGLQSYDPDKDSDVPLWVQNPRFAHYRRFKNKGAPGVASDRDKDAAALKVQLLEHKTTEDVYKTLLDALLSTLHHKLQLTADDVIDPETAIIELGVDSLVAVDMRSWFTNELDLDMPVLKIMGGATVADLIEDAVNRLSKELIPNVSVSIDFQPQGTASDAEGKANGQNGTIEISVFSPTVSKDPSGESQEAWTEVASSKIVISSAHNTDPQSARQLKFSVSPFSPVKSPRSTAAEQPWMGIASPRLFSPAKTPGMLALQGSWNEVGSPRMFSPISSTTPRTRRWNDIQTPRLFSPITSPRNTLTSPRVSYTMPLTPRLPHQKFPEMSPSSNLFKTSGQIEDISKTRLEVAYQRTERMSYGSSRFWFLKQYLDDPTTFNVVFSARLTGRLRVPNLERAVRELGQRHEVLRTAFFADRTRLDEPTQGILPSSQLRLEIKKIVSEKDAENEADTLRNYIFDLERGETVRMLLLSMTSDVSFLVFGFHHISIDGFSLNVVISDLNKLYGGESLPPVVCQFADFAAKQRKEVTNGAMNMELAFWRSEFLDIPEPLPLFPMAEVSSRQVLSKYGYEEVEYHLDQAMAAQIKDQCRRQKVTTFHFCLTVLKILVSRLLEVDDLCIGIADANRTDGSISETVGFLLNLLPLRFKVNSEQSFKDALKEARNKAYAALTHSRLPFDVLLEELDIPRSSTHSPLFQIFMDYKNIAIKSPPMMNCRSESTSTPGRTAYDLVLDIEETPGNNMHIRFRTQKYLYSRRSTGLLLRCYIHLLKTFIANPDTHPSKVRLYDPVDIEAATKIGRGPSLLSSWPATISQRIDNVVHDFGESVAVKDGFGTILTYNGMFKKVNAISSSLLDVGIEEGSVIGVFQEPTSDWICSLLAIWRIGGVYVPLDLRNGLPRLAVIATNCQPAAILCHATTAKDVFALGSQSAMVIDVSTIAGASKQRKILNRAKPGSPAVIMYTSGSTGVPKGIILRHSSIRNEIEGYSKEWGIEKETILQQSAYSVDFSLDQMLSALANGGTLYVVPKSMRQDPAEIARLIAVENITYTKATPSEYSNWLRYGSTHLRKASQWRLAFGGGESFPKSLRQAFRALGNSALGLFNSYGPAEITISCTKTEIPYLTAPQNADEPIPVGFPLPNYAIYIVDKNMDPVPVGVTGEILIAGLGTAIGYLNNEKLTKAKFIPDSYTPPELVAEGWTTAYRSGDFGRLRGDGALLFEGRIDGDTQIKLRGIRIELEDIESTIVQAAGGVLAKAVASVRGDPQFLVAHVEFSDNYPVGERWQFLASLQNCLPLPQYMCPAMIVPLDTIPLSSHSKIDRRAIMELPLPSAPRSSSKSHDTLSSTELVLRDAWTSVLSKDITKVVTIDADTDFFHVGGNSLLLVKLQARIREVFETVLPLIELFESSSLRGMAAKISGAASVDVIDWHAETSVLTDMALSQSSNGIGNGNEMNRTNGVKSGLTVLMSGATGYLGRHILQQLNSDERVSKIHCIAVRQTSQARPREAPFQSDKVEMHSGDLADPFLGLSETDFTRLANEVDLVIHSGSNRSFWDYYQQLRSTNVSSTMQLAKLAAAHQKPLHFISSAGVLQFNSDADAADEASMAAFPPPVDGSMGYVATKWASERYLENAARQFDLPVCIHRVTPAAIVHPPSAELLKEFSDLAIRMKTLPDPAGWNGQFDLIPVRSLAEDICNAALEVASSSRQQQPSLVFKHHRSGTRLKMEDVAKIVELHEGHDSFDRLPAHQWVGKAKKLGISHHFASQDSTVVKADGSGVLVLKR